MEVGDVAHDEESVSAPRRNPEALVGLRGQHVAVPNAESRRALPEINQDVENSSRGDPDEFSLGSSTSLIVESTEDMTCGARVVVLNKVEIDAKVSEGVAVPRFKEEASGVAEDLRLQQEGVMDFGGKYGHRKKDESLMSNETVG